MELKDFISQSLIQIANGVTDASAKLRETSAVINPKHISFRVNGSSQDYVYGELDGKGVPKHVVQRIDFDVAVYLDTSTDIGGKIGIFTGICAAIGSKVSLSDSTVSRIKFSIPMVLPSEESFLHPSENRIIKNS